MDEQHANISYGQSEVTPFFIGYVSYVNSELLSEFRKNYHRVGVYEHGNDQEDIRPNNSTQKPGVGEKIEVRCRKFLDQYQEHLKSG